MAVNRAGIRYSAPANLYVRGKSPAAGSRYCSHGRTSPLPTPSPFPRLAFSINVLIFWPTGDFLITDTMSTFVSAVNLLSFLNGPNVFLQHWTGIQVYFSSKRSFFQLLSVHLWCLCRLVCPFGCFESDTHEETDRKELLTFKPPSGSPVEDSCLPKTAWEGAGLTTITRSIVSTTRTTIIPISTTRTTTAPEKAPRKQPESEPPPPERAPDQRSISPLRHQLCCQAQRRSTCVLTESSRHLPADLACFTLSASPCLLLFFRPPSTSVTPSMTFELKKCNANVTCQINGKVGFSALYLLWSRSWQTGAVLRR